MVSLIPSMNDSFNDRNYFDALKEFYEYINSGKDQLTLDTIRMYIETLIHLNKVEQAAAELEQTAKIWTNIYSKNKLVEKYIMCNRVDLSEEILRNKVLDELDYYYIARKYLLFGYYDYSKKWFEYYINISTQNEYKEKSIMFLKEIYNYIYRDEFIQINYLQFKRNGNMLEPGHIIYCYSVNTASNCYNSQIMPYMVWKVEDEKIYAFPVSIIKKNEKKYNYRLKKEVYLNYNYDRRVKEDLVCIEENQIQKVIDKVKPLDYKNVLSNIYSSICYNGDVSNCKKFYDECVKELDINEFDIIIVPNKQNKVSEFYYVIGITDDSYKVLKTKKINNEYRIEDHNIYTINKNDFIIKAYSNNNKKKEEAQYQLKKQYKNF